VVKLKNTLTVPVKIVKLSQSDEGTIAPGEETEVTLDATTVSIVLQPAT